MHYVPFTTLIELKLAAGRVRDEADIVELIRAHPEQVEATRTHLASIHAEYVQAFDCLVTRAREATRSVILAPALRKARSSRIIHCMEPVTAPHRSIELLVPPEGERAGVLRMLEKKKTTYYAFREIPSEIGGRGFAIHRLGLGNLYHVLIGKSRECSCECLGFLRHGRCRHVLGLLELIREGLGRVDNKAERLTNPRRMADRCGCLPRLRDR